MTRRGFLQLIIASTAGLAARFQAGPAASKPQPSAVAGKTYPLTYPYTYAPDPPREAHQAQDVKVFLPYLRR